MAPRARRHHCWALTILFLVVWIGAFIATHIPAKELPPLHMSDRWLHLYGYAALTASLWGALWAWGHPAVRRILLCVSILTIYGALDEYTQQFVRREPSPIDWLFDCLGIAATLTVAELLCLLPRRH